MSSIAEQYTKEIFRERRYWATWEPNVHLTLGTCGPVVMGIFRPEGHLKDYDIPFNVDRDPTPSDVDYSSRKGLQTTFQAKAGVNTIPNIPQGTAGMRIEFVRDEAAVVATKGSRENRIADQNTLRRQVLQSSKQDDGIPANWFIITHLVKCESASVIIAEGSGAVFEISGKADFAAGAVDLANAKLGMAIKTHRNVGYKMIAQEGATPLFRGIRLKRTFWGNQKLETLGPEPSGAALIPIFEEITPENAF
jgi:hypothetical protein